MKHIFKLLKTSWGIVVFIDIEAIVGEAISDFDIQVTDHFFLKLYWKPNPYKTEVLNWLARAIIDIADQLPTSHQICFNIVELDFNECDFQEEGLYYAMLEWLAKKYQLELPPIDVYFDKEMNRYIFPKLQNV